MGTRGHLFVRCRGRWFIYYNQFDSYLEGLGDAIVKRIPTDPEEYHKWLESMREIYTRLALQFEEHHLPVAVEVGQEDAEVSKEEVYSKCYLAIDDRLERAPMLTMSIDHMNDLFIEYTYTVDLDREIFSVDDGAHFKLSNVPHGREWIKYVGQNSRECRVLKRGTPKEIAASVEWKPDIERKPRTLPDGFNIKTVTPKNSVASVSAPCQHIWMNAFDRIRATYSYLLTRYISSWAPEEFSFREMAFAILSLATGEVSFECPEVLDRRKKEEGYFLIPDAKLRPPQQKLLPRFLEESHIPGVEPGSAPKKTTFWLNNVLVYLTARLNSVEVQEVSVVEVVKAGLDQGLNDFSAMVFSILHAVLVQVKVEKDGIVNVIRSPSLPLFWKYDKEDGQDDGQDDDKGDDQDEDIDEENGDDNDDNQEGDNRQGEDIHNNDDGQEDDGRQDENGHEDDWDDDSQADGDEADQDDDIQDDEGGKPPYEHSNFIALIHFFNAAESQKLTGTKSSIFPNEVLAIIMQFSDVHTYHTLAKVSSYCRKVAYTNFRLNNDYAVVGKGDRYGLLLLKDLQTGAKIRSSFSQKGRHVLSQLGLMDSDDDEPNDKELCMSPMIGIADVKRTSIMDRIKLTFSSVGPKDPFSKKKSEYPEQTEFYWTTDPRVNKAERVLEIQDYEYSGSVEEAWGRYLSEMVKGSNSFMVAVGAATFRCLLRPGYRELKLDGLLFKNGLRAFVRRPRDDSPKEWEMSLEYATSALALVEATGDNRRNPPDELRGCFAIVAFGTRYKLFYYVHYDPNPSPPLEPATNNSYSKQIAAKVTDPVSENRLIQLIPGDEPMDLRNSEGWDKLAHWLGLISGSSLGKDQVYDLISDKYVSTPKRSPE